MFGFFARDKSRFIQLDFLRGVAIVLVMFRHMVVRPPKAGFLEAPAQILLRFGWTGVDLFFVLSGFLVGGLLFNELKNRSSFGAGRFMVRRIFKIWPAYFVYIIFLTVTLFIAHTYVSNDVAALKSTFTLLWPNLLHIQIYIDPPRIHTWSLAVEEHFYLALPLVLFLTTFYKKGRVESIPAIPIISAILIVGCTAMRFRVNYYSPLKESNDFLTHLRMDGLFFGVMIAYFYYFSARFVEIAKKMRLILILTGLVIVSPMMVVDMQTAFVKTFGFTMIYVGFGLILTGVYFSPADEGTSGWFFQSRFARAMAFIGFYSYSIYLWHFEVFIRMLHLLKNVEVNTFTGAALWLGAYVVYFIVSFAVGILIGALVERPFLKLRDRLFPSRARALPGSTGAG